MEFRNLIIPLCEILLMLDFISKLSDADMENSETNVWLDFSFACEYLEKSTYDRLLSEVIEIGKLLNFMILNPERFGSKKLL
jgi:four helix bundle protein